MRGFVALLVLGAASALPQPIAITHAFVVDPRSGEIQNNQTVLVQTGAVRVVAAALLLPAGARRLDARGKYLIPGLWDMHTHVGDLPAGWEELYLANGIVGVREMACTQENWPAQQAHRKRGVAPYLVSTIGAIDRDGAQAVHNAVEAARVTDKLARLGVDFFKVYNGLSRDAYFAIAAEARKRNLPFTGHVPDAVSVAEAARTGQKSIEHMDGVMLACSRAEEGYRKLWVTDGRLPRPLVLNSFSSEKVEALAGVLLHAGTWMVPTLTEMRSETLDARKVDDANLQYMSKDWLADWKRTLSAMRDLGFERRWFAKHREILGLFERKGVKILAGTDAPWPYCVPGFSLHDELELLVGSGLSARGALAAATVNATEFLNVVPRGVVLLGANPLLDISNTRKIEAVIVDGRVLARKDLDAMLAATRKRVR